MYQKQNDELLSSFLGRTFFAAWENEEDPRYENFRRIELQINAKCNQDCKYCYYAKYGEELYPESISKSKNVLSNLSILLDWLIENGYAPGIDFFSGEPLYQKVGFDALSMILDKFTRTKRKPKCIVVPTNYTFLLKKNLTSKVEDLVKESREMKIPITLSASFDGKHCEKNRPLKSTLLGDRRGDKFYDKCFAFGKKYKFGFHPMVYSELIEEWIKNFIWFQRKFEEFDIPFSNIYLLEVRNSEWSEEQIKEYMRFVDFLIKWTFNDRCGEDINRYLNFLFKGRGYNILSNCLTTIGRGLGCSLQSCLYVRLGDLAIVPCHRQSYEQFLLGKFKVEDKRIVGIKALDAELAIAEITFDFKTQPQCEQCLIKNVCQGQCVGAMYEVTGDPFSPIPSVCKLERAKIVAMIKAYQDLKIFNVVLNSVNENKKIALEQVANQMKEEQL